MKKETGTVETETKKIQEQELPVVSSAEDKSRLKAHLKKRAIKTTLFALLGIIVLLILIFTFGIQFLINFSLTLEKLKGSSVTPPVEKTATYIAPPMLDAMVSATNSASLKVTGYSDINNVSIKLYVNNRLEDTTAVDSDKKFVFSNVTLNQGDNEIKAKVITSDNKESEYSDSVKITYNNKAPSLDISSPQDGQTYKDDHQIVSGKTDPGAKVTVNDFWAIVDDQGKFTYNIKLQNGENTIKVEATDSAGNKTTKQIKATFSP